MWLRLDANVFCVTDHALLPRRVEFVNGEEGHAGDSEGVCEEGEESVGMLLGRVVKLGYWLVVGALWVE